MKKQITIQSIYHKKYMCTTSYHTAWLTQQSVCVCGSAYYGRALWPIGEYCVFNLNATYTCPDVIYDLVIAKKWKWNGQVAWFRTARVLFSLRWKQLNNTNGYSNIAIVVAVPEHAANKTALFKFLREKKVSQEIPKCFLECKKSAHIKYTSIFSLIVHGKRLAWFHLTD